MPTIIRDQLDIDGVRYAIDALPLDAWLAGRADRPAAPATPWRQNGYVATWALVDAALYLTQLSREPLARLYAERHGAAPAVWFSGFVRGWHGERRDTGYPPRTFYDDEIVLEIVAGCVTHQWVLDLRTVPGQTDEELRLTLPPCLWPARLAGTKI